MHAGTGSKERLGNLQPYRKRDRRREGVANLPIGRRLLSGERPLIGKALESCHHAQGKSWHSKKIALLKLMLLTDQRKREVAGMLRAEVSEDGATWSLPGLRTKNGKPHVVPLAPAARRTLASMPQIGNSPLIFTTNGRTPVSGFSKAKVRLDREMEPDAPWRLHDLRRTAATGMAEIGIAPHVVEVVTTPNEAVMLITAVCALPGNATYLEDTRDWVRSSGIAAAVEERNTPALYRWLMDGFSYQGISDEVAADYIARHGNANWATIELALAGQASRCPKLATFDHYKGCAYRKPSSRAAIPSSWARVRFPSSTSGRDR